MTQLNNKKFFWLVTFVAAAIIMITGGIRNSLGLFVQPILTDSTLSITTISFAMAVLQLMWGVAQPVTGALANRYGAYPVLFGCGLLLAIGCASLPWMLSALGLTFTLGVMLAFGTGAASFSILMSLVTNKIPPEMRGISSGVINAGNSFGQFIFAPTLQFFILTPMLGWQGALYICAGISLLVLPLARWLSGGKSNPHKVKVITTSEQTLSQAIRVAFKDKSYILTHLSFFTCGFHIAFLITHLPTEIKLFGMSAQVASWTLAIIGLSNVFGSLFIGWCVGHWRSKYILFWMYGSRMLLIIIYLMSPKTELTFYAFGIGLGFTWLATVPPTAATVSKLFGVRYLATLFGLTLLSHQIGGFLGAYFGGLAISKFGNYEWMWYADLVLAGLAAILCLPIKEPKIVKAK